MRPYTRRQAVGGRLAVTETLAENLQLAREDDVVVVTKVKTQRSYSLTQHSLLGSHGCGAGTELLSLVGDVLCRSRGPAVQ